MQRSGSTLQFQIAARLVEDSGLGKRVEWIDPEHFSELREKYADEQGWKVFKTHDFTAEMGVEFARQNAKGVYIYRDIRDVIVSLLRKEQVPFGSLPTVKIVRNSLSSYQHWTSLPDVLISKYEAVLVDLPGEVRRIAIHLGIDIDNETCEKIAAEYHLEQQRERIQRVEQGRLEAISDRGSHYDPHTLLHTNHIRSGEIGAWKGVLTTLQLAVIEAEASDWLATNGYDLQLSLPVRITLRNLYKIKVLPGYIRRRLLR